MLPGWCSRQVSLTGIWRWNVKGSWCVRLEVCASPESLAAKYSGHQSMVFLPQPTLLLTHPLLLMVFFFIFLTSHFVKAWYSRLFSIFRKLRLPIATYFLNLCSMRQLFPSFTLIQWVSPSKAAVYPLFSHVKLLHLSKCSEIQTQAPCNQAPPLLILQSSPQDYVTAQFPSQTFSWVKQGPSN